MNHVIHNPYWYREQKLISDAELERALSHPDTIFVPDIAQFNTDQILVACHPRRWEVKTEAREHALRILEITVSLFDVILPHTPVNACGFNFVFTRNIERDAGGVIADVVRRCPIDFGALSATEIRFRTRDGDRADSMHVTPIADGFVRFAVNVNYDLNKKDPGKQFALSDTMSNFERKLDEVDGRISSITDQLKAYVNH